MTEVSWKFHGRNTREENKAIKEDRGDELWNVEEGDTEEDKKKKANKKRHKDTDAAGRRRAARQSMHGMFSRAVGFARNAARNVLTSLVYNMLRYEQIQRLGMN